MNDRDKMYKDAAAVLAIVKYLLIFGIAALVIYFGASILVVLIPFAIGLILARTAYTLSAQWQKLIALMRRSKRFPIKIKPVYVRGLAPSRRQARAAGVFYILVVIMLLAALTGIIAATVSQVRSLTAYIPTFIRDTSFINKATELIRSWSERFGGFVDENMLEVITTGLLSAQERLIEALPGLAAGLLNWAGRILGNLPAIIIAIVVVLMSGYYFAADSRSIYKFMYRNVNNRQFVRKTFGLISSLSNTLFRVIGGYILLLFITFIEALIGFTLIGMPYAVVLSVVAAIVDFLPLLGISATMVPVIIYMFVNGNIFGGVGAIVMLVVISVVRRFVEPAILGNAMHLHPMATLFSMILGVSAYGLSGIFIGPIILVIVLEVFSQFGFDRQVRNLLGRFLHHIGNQN
ncbi:MAG: AI-2E family transporter [Eubacteriales bacterium]|nr:AI-2E family transporter [Eubacteriales bacterium]MDD3503534.1 AI-2E family transporter [Eubacteriales bacterium]